MMNYSQKIYNALRFVPVVLLVSGGSILVFSVTPVLVGLALRLRERRTLAIREDEDSQCTRFCNLNLKLYDTKHTLHVQKTD